MMKATERWRRSIGRRRRKRKNFKKESNVRRAIN
jgi:hypothetical protein